MADIREVPVGYSTPDGAVFASKHEAQAHANRPKYLDMAKAYADSKGWAKPVYTRAVNTIVDFLVYIESKKGKK